jgi:predicted CXXCH cytochrome family protein
MPLALILLLAVTVPGHRDWSKVPGRCEACHEGHAASGTKLLPSRDPDACLACHGGDAATGEMVQRGLLSPQAAPADMTRTLTLPYQHSASLGCLACHAGHGVQEAPYEPGRTPKPSTKRTGQYEYELCGTCHSSDLIYQSPASFHPVTSAGRDGHTPSLDGRYGERPWINCSDCHGAGEADLPSGVHGSRVPAILKADYQLQDGFEESDRAYAQCYGCHDRNSILADASFPLHKKHLDSAKTSCFTCHMSHASRTLPHLLAIEDDSRADRILPDRMGRKGYEDTGDRSGVCYLTCHNVGHDGWTYGPEGMKRSLQSGKVKVMPGARKGPTGIKPK